MLCHFLGSSSTTWLKHKVDVVSTCSSVFRSPNSCMKVVSEGKRLGSKKWSRLKSSSTVFCRGVPVSSTLCSCGNTRKATDWIATEAASQTQSLFFQTSICLLLIRAARRPPHVTWRRWARRRRHEEHLDPASDTWRGPSGTLQTPWTCLALSVLPGVTRSAF